MSLTRARVTDNKGDTDTGATKGLKKPPKKDSGQSVDGVDDGGGFPVARTQIKAASWYNVVRVDDGGKNSSGKNTDQEISDDCWTVQGIVDNI